jgi:hypothetical protein
VKFIFFSSLNTNIAHWQVHQFLLTRDSPVFFAMFTLPQGMVAVEGLSDALPICLSGDRAEDFRSFLKYLYTP